MQTLSEVSEVRTDVSSAGDRRLLLLLGLLEQPGGRAPARQRVEQLLGRRLAWLLISALSGDHSYHAPRPRPL